jgi:hypothetical protein
MHNTVHDACCPFRSGHRLLQSRRRRLTGSIRCRCSPRPHIRKTRPSVDAQMYDIDLFGTSEATIQTLHGAGRTVVCYFSAGSPDNVDGFDNKNGLGLTEQDALDYDKFLASEGHARDLSVGLKNSLGLVSSLVSSFDWALNEECLQYDECDSLEPFISAGKAVFHCEYAKNTNDICGKAPQGFSTIVKNLDLDAVRLACN